MANFYQNTVYQGIGTFGSVVPNAGTYKVDVKASVPTLVNGGGVSALQIVIKVNSSTKYTGAAGATGAWYEVDCAAGDTINVVTSSANAVDNALNAVKLNVSISEGI